MKKAMNAISTRLLKEFGYTCINGKRVASCSELRGGYLVLQMHDELLYEVCRKDLKKVSEIVQCEMEHVEQLMVKLPVRVKVGSSWGALKEL